MDEYVALLQAFAVIAGEDVSVNYVGSVQDSWSLFVNYNEICYYTASDIEDIYNPMIFDPDNGDYCFVETEILDFFQDRPLTEYFGFVITRPAEIGGYYLSSSQELLDDCEEFEDDIFFPTICNDVNTCPETYVNDELCTSPCISCPDGSLAITCTNVDSSLVDTCNVDDDDVGDDITDALVEYFRTIPTTPYKGKGKGKGKGRGKGNGKGKGKGKGNSKKMKSGEMMGMSKSKKNGMKSKKAPKPKKEPKWKKESMPKKESKSEMSSKKPTKRAEWYKGKGK